MEPSDCSIKVFCRFRPQNEFEIKNGGIEAVNLESDGTICIDNKLFTFDHTFHPNTDQLSIYETVAKPLVTDLLSGYNSTIFVYGQTSSGKTYTMEGDFDENNKRGIIPRIIQDIFAYIYEMDENLELHIKVSYFEIYLDSIRDLLDSNNVNLGVHEDKNGDPFVKGITERFVSCPAEMYDLIQDAKSNRHIASTNMNEHSSRSHSIFLINLRQENTATKKSKIGKLFLVDLAGSEKVSKTGASGIGLDEARNINKSLGALGNVISALSENKSHIPYRDSKLTRILQESLGGNSRTTIVICCSLSSLNIPETVSTLRFGQRAKTITNKVSINEELSAEEWKRKFEKERTRALRYKQHSLQLEAELNKFRKGSSVSFDKELDINTKTNEHISSIDDSPPNKISKHFESSKSFKTKEIQTKDEVIGHQRKKIDEFHVEDIKNKKIINELNNRMNRLSDELELRNNDKEELIKALSELAVHYAKEAQRFLDLEDSYKDMKSKYSNNSTLIIENEQEINKLKHLLSIHEDNFTSELNKLIKIIKDVNKSIGVLPDQSMATHISNNSSLYEARSLINHFKNNLELFLAESNDKKLLLVESGDKLTQYEIKLQQTKSHLETANNTISEMKEDLKNSQHQHDDLKSKMREKEALIRDISELKKKLQKLNDEKEQKDKAEMNLVKEIMQKHQILMQTNVQLSQEIPKLQVYCKNSQERVKYLEKILFDTKIQTERETKKVPQIAKPIKPTDRH
ncbi:hypothetical protein HZS_7409, partial [Henneguya salminicola]